MKTSRIAQTFRGMCGGRSARLGLFAAVVIIFAGGSALRPSVEAQVGPIVQENTQTGSRRVSGMSAVRAIRRFRDSPPTSA